MVNIGIVGIGFMGVTHFQGNRERSKVEGSRPSAAETEGN